MKRKMTLVLALLFALALPLGAAAATNQDNHSDHDGHDHSAHEGHEGMAAEGEMYMLGDDTQAGVKGMAHVKDVREAMSKMGMDLTHHFMVMFANMESGEPVEEGTVAVKITGPDGKTGQPIRLMGMEGHFGADVTLAQKGKYTFQVGTKLPDGQKRVFEYTFDNK